MTQLSFLQYLRETLCSPVLNILDSEGDSEVGMIRVRIYNWATLKYSGLCPQPLTFRWTLPSCLAMETWM